MNPAAVYILNQPPPFQSILLHLQLLLEARFPEIDLQFKWKIPFYYLSEKPFCYLNSSPKKGFVDVGFWLSEPLSKYNEFLVSEDRKVVKSLRYTSIEDIREEVLFSVLSEVHQLTGKGFYKRRST